MKKAIVFLLPTLIFLAILETIARLSNLPPYPTVSGKNLYRESPTNNFELVPGFEGKLSSIEFEYNVFVNEIGLRDVHNGLVNLEKSDKKRILFIGDSMTFGTGVEQEETFSGRFNQTEKYEAFNLGVSSYGTFHTYGRLLDHGKNINPDVVVYTMYLGNDIYDNLRGFVKVVKDGYLGDMGMAYTQIQIDKIYGQDIENNFYDLVKEARQSSEAQKLAESIEVPKQIEESKVNSAVYSEYVYLNPLDQLFTRSSELYRYLRYKLLYNPNSREKFEKAGVSTIKKCLLPYSMNVFHKDYPLNQVDNFELELTKNALLEIKSYVENELGAKFVVAFFPVKEQLNEKLLAYEIEEGCVNGAIVDYNRPFEIFIEFAVQNDIEYIYSLNVLKAAYENNKNPHFNIDSHVNAYGHELVFQYYLSKLEELL